MQRNDKENCPKSQLMKSQKSVYTIIRLLPGREAPQYRGGGEAVANFFSQEKNNIGLVRFNHSSACMS
jgi:hypothetical protein